MVDIYNVRERDCKKKSSLQKTLQGGSKMNWYFIFILAIIILLSTVSQAF